MAKNEAAAAGRAEASVIASPSLDTIKVANDAADTAEAAATAANTAAGKARTAATQAISTSAKDTAITAAEGAEMILDRFGDDEMKQIWEEIRSNG